MKILAPLYDINLFEEHQFTLQGKASHNESLENSVWQNAGP